MGGNMKNIKTMHNAVGTLMERREVTDDVVNEAMYTVIDPRGNPGPIAPKQQVVRYAKKMGGAKKGYFVVPSKNIGKAQKLYGKFGADLAKLQEPMSDLFYESEVSEAAPKMRKNEEAEHLQELMNSVANAQKGGMGSRYGKEFDKAKTKALRALKDMVSYSKIGI